LSRKYLSVLAAALAAVLATVGLLSSGVASAGNGPPAPRSDRSIPNLGQVELRIEAYYGDPNMTGVPSAASNYARQTNGITARAQHFLQAALHTDRGQPHRCRLRARPGRGSPVPHAGHPARLPDLRHHLHHHPVQGPGLS
jgi:hypothetical protein